MKPCELNYCQALPCLTSLVFFVKGGESNTGNRGSRGSCLNAKQNTTSRSSFQRHPPALVCNSNLFKIASFSDRLLWRYEPEFGKVCCVAHSICPFNGHSSMCLYRVFVFGEYEGRRQITILQLIHDLPTSHQSYCNLREFL